MNITRHNIDLFLDQNRIECAMKNGNWWKVRRNGATRRDKNRIYIPFKFGLYGYGHITELDFIDGVLRTDWFRLQQREEVS